MKTILYLLCCTVACIAQNFPYAFPERGEPRLLSAKEYPVSQWKEKSKKTFPWFVEKADGWYINWDAEARELKHLVIHHSATAPGATPEDISVITRQRLYDTPAVYGNKQYTTPYIFGLPPHSGHVINGKETFIPYHHLIYEDGKVVTTLIPFKKVGATYFVDMIGWGAGNWATNCQSIQICLVGNYEHSKPPQMALKSLQSLIESYQKLSTNITVVSHNSVRATKCPGEWWEEWSVQFK